MVAHGTACLGPVTHAGCGALCPSVDRGCYGCFGPMESPNAPSLSKWFETELDVPEVDVIRLYRTLHTASEPFQAESERLAGSDG
jgi:coenzyme F420-reducing hydrogenase gamma subunit